MLLITVLLPAMAFAQREVRLPAAIQGFTPTSCRQECVLDSLVVELDRGRRGTPAVVTARLLLIDTVTVARRNAPPAPKERGVPVWLTCDSLPCAAGVVTGRISDKRLDDQRVVRRTQVAWPLPEPLLLRLARTSSLLISVDGRGHAVAEPTLIAARSLVETVKATLASAPYSPRMQLSIATFALFGIPGDSTMAEDVGTATEPLMIPDATTAAPTRVATLTMVGRGADALPLLVQDDATGAAPLFGVNEKLSVVLPGRTGRRGVVSATVVARQRVDAMRDACQGMKPWIYLVTMSPADLIAAQRGMIASPRAGEGVDRWNGTAVREPVTARLAPSEQRAITAGRAIVARFVKERAASGVLAADVQVLGALSRNGGLITNFGVFTKDANGSWRFPTLSLRPAICP
jgi:hypothetical protein